MPIYNAPVTDMQFILHEVLKVSGSGIPGYDELEPDFTSAVLEEAGKLARDVLAPLNRVGDMQGCRLENGVVRTPEASPRPSPSSRKAAGPRSTATRSMAVRACPM